MLNYIKGLPEKLSRVTSGGKLIREIDGLRFLAIFPVIVQHLHERYERNAPLIFSSNPSYEITSFFAGRGFVGVYIFFVISGFILALPFASHWIHKTKKVQLKSYYWRRITRLEPPYILAMSAFFIILITIKGNELTELFPHFIASIFYVHNIIYYAYTPINPPAWTLEIEIQFYLIAPLLASLIFRIGNKYYRRLVLIGFILALLLVQDYLGLMTTRASLTILGHLQYFLIGFILADFFLCEWKKKAGQFKRLDLIAILSFPALLMTWSWDYILINRIIFCLLLFTLFYSCFRGYYVNKFFTNPWIMAIGGMCYTIYLLHLPLAELLIVFTKNLSVSSNYAMDLLFQLLIYLPLLFAVSVVFYLLVEKPCMDKNWPSKLKTKTKKIWLNLQPVDRQG